MVDYEKVASQEFDFAIQERDEARYWLERAARDFCRACVKYGEHYEQVRRTKVVKDLYNIPTHTKPEEKMKVHEAHAALIDSLNYYEQKVIAVEAAKYAYENTQDFGRALDAIAQK